MAGYEGVLASIPGLGGYLASQQQRQGREAQQLQQTTGVLGLLSNIKAQEDQEQIRGVLMQSPKLEDAIPKLTQLGPMGIQAATQLGQLSQAMQKQNQGQAIGAGGLRMPDGTIVAPAARPAEQKPVSIGAGGLRMPDGTIVPPVAKPAAAPTPSDLAKYIRERDALPANDPNRATYNNRINTLTSRTPLLSVDNRAESSYAQMVGKGAAERDETQVTAALAVPENIAKVDQLIKHLNTSDALTGLGSEIIKNVERARVLITQNEKAGKRVSDTELLDAMLGSDVFPMIGALGIGARGLDTPAEREFLRKVMTGTVDMNKDTLLRMAKMRRDVSDRLVQRYNQRVERGELDRYFQFSGMPKKKVEIPKNTMPVPAVSRPVTPKSVLEEADAILRGGG